MFISFTGLGTMSISNSIGSNTFDILVCLGLPWLIRSAILSTSGDTENFVQIQSTGLAYSAVLLMFSLVLLYTLLAANKFYLDRKVGIIALLMYLVFLTAATLFELNMFFPVNLPTC